MKTKHFREKNKNELSELLLEERNRLLELRMRIHESKVKNVKEAREIRKNIARILTLLKQ